MVTRLTWDAGTTSIYRRKMLAESSDHVQWRDNVAVLLFLSFSLLSLFLSRVRVHPLSFPYSVLGPSGIHPTGIQSATSKRRESMYEEHSVPRLRLQGKRSCSRYSFPLGRFAFDFGLCTLSLSLSLSRSPSPSRFEQICVKIEKKSSTKHTRRRAKAVVYTYMSIYGSVRASGYAWDTWERMNEREEEEEEREQDERRMRGNGGKYHSPSDDSGIE